MTLAPTSNRGGSSAAGAAAQIADSTLSVAGASITFSGIAATYNHLLIVASLRTVKVATSDTIALQLNGDTGANYYAQSLTVAGNASASGAESLGATSAQCGHAPGSSATANQYAPHSILLPDYRLAHRKAFAADVMDPFGTGTGTLLRGLYSGLWANTAAITSIAIISGTAATNLEAGSRATLYGLT